VSNDSLLQVDLVVVGSQLAAYQKNCRSKKQEKKETIEKINGATKARKVHLLFLRSHVRSI
jgi:hypothetical protein